MGKRIGTFLIAELLSTLVPVGATTCWVGRIRGAVGPDSWTIVPADPTTKDVIGFSGPTRVYGNTCVASVLQGYPNLTIDSAQRKIELWFQPIPPIPCPQIWLPLCGLEGQFGPLESGDWLFFSAQTDVPFSIPFRVAQAEYILTIRVEGDGAVRLEPDPPYRLNDEVTVYAEPNAGSVFARWRGDVLWENQTSNPLSLILDVDKSVTAVFGRLILVPQDNLTIQAAIDAASDGDKITVSPGIYVENLNLRGKNIVLCSTNPGDPDVVATTVIDGNQMGSVVTFAGTEDHTCVLTGFTIRNGKADYGAGICGGTWEMPTHATIRGNVIEGNWAGGDESAHGCGGGAAYCDGVIEGNTISWNTGTIAGYWSWSSEGGGLYSCDGVIRNNTISDNSAGLGGALCRCGGLIGNNEIVRNSVRDGGGLAWCDGVVRNNTIVGNSAHQSGGGLLWCDGLIEGNVISGNSARNGGGLYGCEGTIRNNLIAWNAADQGQFGDQDGGGICFSTVRPEAPTIINCTIVGNAAGRFGGGVAYCYSPMYNCVIWGNSAPDGAQVYSSDAPTYSCIQDWTEGGEGNTSDDPLFADPDGPDNDPQTHADNDYRPLPISPCIDAGYNDPQLPETDIAGMPRILFGGKSVTVDMGAYEYYINRVEASPTADRIILTWSSAAKKIYSVLFSDDLIGWHLAAEELYSSGNQTTSWTDDGALTGVPPSLVPRRFYRILQTQ